MYQFEDLMNKENLLLVYLGGFVQFLSYFQAYNMKSKVIILDGVIAAGKTSTMKAISSDDHPGMLEVQEPVASYRHFNFDEQSFNPLEEYYVRPPHNAVALQLYIADCLRSSLENSLHYPTLLCDRYLTSINVFTQSMLDVGFIGGFAAAFIRSKVKEMLREFEKKLEVVLVLFLDTDIELCLERCLRRGRKEETSFNMKPYLECLRKNYLSYYEAEFPDKLRIIKNNDMEQIKKCLDCVCPRGEGTSGCF
jgi:deoxyadenosine/deoxycytidine kinase